MSENNTALSGSEQGTESPTPPKIRIVVADDHPIFRDGLCKLLALEEDFEVVAQAQDGRQVLDVLQQHQIGRRSASSLPMTTRFFATVSASSWRWKRISK